MTDRLTHECGIAFLRLRKPLSYYKEKYGTHFWGMNKMFGLMQKQVNRGQDGAGIANIKLNTPPGTRYISRKRALGDGAVKILVQEIQTKIMQRLEGASDAEKADPFWLKEHVPFSGEMFLGHLRYGTYGGLSIENCHPFLRQNNWMHRNLVLAGNFNMTNVDDQFRQLVELGQHPKERADTITILEKIGHFLDEQIDDLYTDLRKKGMSKKEISPEIQKAINLEKILKKSAKKWDGGYVMAGMLGHGDSFVFRDPNGIRPAFQYIDDEVVVVASERSVIQTVFDADFKSITPLTRGAAMVIKADGTISEHQILRKKKKLSCSFERIYFSRGNDSEIYRERKKLGELVAKHVLKQIKGDIKNSVFSYIPNTAETCFFGLVKEIEKTLKVSQLKELVDLPSGSPEADIKRIVETTTRVEKIAIKDAKLRTFITNDENRDSMVGQVYDITYGAVKPTDNLVIIDDSIVRGTTLKKSILSILDRCGAKHVVVVSSAPQIRYPDCYGIDMAKIGDFVAFKAAIALLEETNQMHILQAAYEEAKSMQDLPKSQWRNCVKDIYASFTYEEVTAKITELLRPANMESEVSIVFQTVDDLHKAIPKHLGDWYFTGNYPTQGGIKVVNRALINFVEKNNQRAY